MTGVNYCEYFRVQLGRFLRRYPVARVLVIVYMVTWRIFHFISQSYCTQWLCCTSRHDTVSVCLWHYGLWL